MPVDPRLQNPELLALAAYRLRERREHQVPDWRYAVGISALLDAARSLPQREPFDLPALDECSGMARLLAEARTWQKGVEGGT